MGVEIERKFLLKNTDWQDVAGAGQVIKQGYLSLVKERTVRVRVKDAKGFLTIKGKTVNTTRVEFEYEIPLAEAEALLNLCEGAIIDKTRYNIVAKNLVWEVDVFEGDNKGLVIAEVELESEAQEINLPDWIGEEVSADSRYYNANLVTNPFKTW